ncbi:pyridoxamine 5'-phosphate oxidase family protein [Spirosoma pomorum]
MTQITEPTVTLNGTTYTLAELNQFCWQQLAEAPEAEKSNFKTMAVATCTHDGANARMTVLRKVDSERKYVWFHTDARAEKVIQLEMFPNAGLLFWDADNQIQLRLTVETRLHTDDFVADDQWEELSPSSRKLYLSEKKPGSEVSVPYPGFPEQFTDELPSKQDSEAGRTNFAVIECRVLNMEYLHLSRQGQTRALFQYEPVVKLSWLAP